MWVQQVQATIALTEVDAAASAVAAAVVAAGDDSTGGGGGDISDMGGGGGEASDDDGGGGGEVSDDDGGGGGGGEASDDGGGGGEASDDDARYSAAILAQSELLVGLYFQAASSWLNCCSADIDKGRLRQPKCRSHVSAGQCQASEEACSDNMVTSYVRTVGLAKAWVCF